VKRETLRHPKTFDLAARLKCSRAEALGYLTLLWDFTSDVAPCGDVGKHPDGAIARACEWPGEPSEFVASLVASKFLDLDPTHRLLIHHWPDHCERWVKAKLEKLSLAFAVATVEVTTEPTVEASPPRDQPEPTRTNPTRTNPASVEIPPDLASPPFPAAWTDWIAYRSERRLSNRDRTLTLQLETLAPLGPAAAAECLKTSIRNGWQGIFPEKGNGHGKPASHVGPGQRYRGS
jgi:hypothetical protein